MKPTGGGYFEGILQLRETTDEIANWVRNKVQKDAKAVITKEKPVTNGIDLYFNDQHYLQSLGKKLKLQFGGTLTISRRLHTVHKITSKLLYRVSVLYKPLPFKRGDIIDVHGEQAIVLAVGSKVQIRYLSSSKKDMIRADRLR
ncbi:hypothetical protein J4219_02320 [Candidatus Woesearchaeota archaeon]|nr:hypothetical protein [Candidatus Woesearchaeota archaeon]